MITIFIFDTKTDTVDGYTDVTESEAAEAFHALSGTEIHVKYSAHEFATAFAPYFAEEALREVKPVHNVETGACVCTSFTQTITTGPVPSCKVCKHPAHNSRTFCGSLR
jgi:hypothetical protein